MSIMQIIMKTTVNARRKPMDLAILKSFTWGASNVEREIVRVLGKQEDYLDDFEFTPIHIAVLGLYEPTDSERPSLEQLIEFVDMANNAPIGTNWSYWKSRFQKRSPLYGSIIEQFRASSLEGPNVRKVIHNLLDQKDRKFHWTPLHWAAATNRADKMRVLVQHGADPFIQSNLNANIIHAAVESNALLSLGYALEISQSNPTRLDINQANIWGESPLIMAAQGCLVDCVRLLLKAGADCGVRQENKQVALHYAGLSTRGEGRRETVGLLCGQEGDHINARDEDGRSPIFDFLDDATCVERLIRSGSRVDLLDNEGSNVFHHACVQDESETLQTLLQSTKTARILEVKNKNENTALFEALQHGSIDCAIALLNLEGIGDAFSGDGWAPVHYAAKLGDIDLLKKVVNHSTFRKGAKTKDGKTAQVVAMEAGTWCGRVKEILRLYSSVT